MHSDTLVEKVRVSEKENCVWGRGYDQPHLTLRIFVCTHGVACFGHGFLYDADRIGHSSSRIYAFLGDQCRNFAPQR